MVQREKDFAIIGSGKEHADQIKRRTNDLLNFGRGAPNFAINRSIVLGDMISLIFQDQNSKNVGGPLQIIHINPPPIQSKEAYLWPYLQENQIEVRHEGDKTIMRNPKTGKTFTLLPIWEWR
jgi:hypothetical protein